MDTGADMLQGWLLPAVWSQEKKQGALALGAQPIQAAEMLAAAPWEVSGAKAEQHFPPCKPGLCWASECCISSQPL